MLHPDIERIALLGWRCVPASRSKKGLWKGYIDDATSDLEQLEQWASKNPGCCWKVIPQGSGVWALDVDRVGPEHANDGIAALKELVSENGDIPDRPHGRSAGGGHLLVFKDAGHPIRTKSGHPRPGLDPRAGRCAFTVSPSRTASGSYRWVVAPWELNPPPAPDWLLKLVAPPLEPTRPRIPAIATTDRARRALGRAVGRVMEAAEGGRNDTLNAQSYAVSRYVAAGLLGEQEASEALYAAARQIGLAHPEIRATIQSAFRSGYRHPVEATWGTQ